MGTGFARELLRQPANSSRAEPAPPTVPASRRSGDASWRLREPREILGFALWWDCTLAPGIVLSTSPHAPRTHWDQIYLPLLEPIAAKAGETLAIELRSRTSVEAGTHVAWTAMHRDGKGREIGRQALNLDKGFLP